MYLGNLAIFHLERIAHAAGVAKDSGCTIEAKVKSFGELGGGVGNEANLYVLSA